ncbi:hypothetical protein ABLE68_19470 [Nocardioides sp. CN2-186]|uniref:hypothetical protein n=1 Tax=Nocardioides tweenelious TaxID=3156607 RepID=UPI0032B42CE0
MRSNQLITGVLAAVATSGLIGLGSAAHAGEPTTTYENGTVLECSGTWKGDRVYALVYENSTAGNTVQVVINDGQYGASHGTKHDLVQGRRVHAAVKLDGKRAVIRGDAHAVGRRTPVHEELEDAGQHIVTDGTHRRLANHVTLTWKGVTTPLDCAGSFVYDLQVTRTPVE